MPPSRQSVAWSVAITACLLAAAGCNESTAPNADCSLSSRSRVVAFPAGWGGSAPASYQLGTDQSCPHGGSAAGFLASTSVNPAGFATLTQLIRADEFRGKRVRWHGWVRHQDIAAYGGLWMRVDGPGVMLAFDNSSDHPLAGSSGWKEVDVVLNVPSEAIGIGFGVLLVGAGDLIVDDLAMDVVTNSTPVTDQLLVPVPSAFGDSTAVAALYAMRLLRGTNLSFEGVTAAARANGADEAAAHAGPVPVRRIE